MNRQRVYRLSVLGLVAAGLWQASPAQAREAASSEFLSAIAGVDIPSTAREQKGDGSPTPPAAAAQDRTLRGLRSENKRLRQRQAALEAQLRQRRAETPSSPPPAERDKAQRDISALQKQVSELTGTRDDLQKRLAQANTLRAENAALKAAAQTQQQTVQKEAAAQAEKSTAAQAQLETLTVENAALKAEALRTTAVQTQVTELRSLRDVLQLKLKQSLQESHELQKRLTAQREGSKAAGDGALAQMKTLREENAALKAAAQSQQQTAQKEAAAQAEKSTAAQAQLETLTVERDELKQQLAGLMKRQGQESKPGGVAPELRTERQKQAYASGVMFAGSLQRTLSVQRDLGADLSAALLIAGLTDGINDKVRLDGQSLQGSYRTLMTQLVSREKDKYREGVKRLEKMTAGATLIKRNGSLFFVQTRKGSGKVASGDRVRFDLTESVVKGKTLRAEKGVDAIVDNKLPYIVEQALTLAGRGGEMTVYCTASDVYPLDQLPEGLFPYSLIQYQFKVAAKPAK